MSLFSVRSISLWFAIFLYYFISHHVFEKVFLTSEIIIDEEFHIPQGLEYCNFIFDRWNPKITTLPGLYLVTAIILGPLKLCSIYWLRYINLAFSVLNLYLFVICFGLSNKKPYWINLISSINLALLPPLYFFSHLYYTDVVSLTFILLLVIFNAKDRHFLASLFGILSVIVRQTNIIFVTLLFGEYVLKEFGTLLYVRERSIEISFKNLCSLWINLKCFDLRKLSNKFFINCAAYLTVAITFVLFVIINGSIVVGDKTAHTAAIHVPQLFYFCVFSNLFGWPYFVVLLEEFRKFMFKNRWLSLFVIVSMFLFIHQNTLEHPYLLADNRHYTFYVWHRFYAKYFFFRYLMIPVYYFGGFCMFYILSRYRTSFFVMYMICITCVLILQKMIEVRYFLVPFILFRFHFNAKPWQLFCEFLYFLVINIAAFNIFFAKNIYWPDFSYAQKLIW